MTITVVCRKSKIAWLFLPCVLLLASCGKRQVTKSATVEAQQTAGKIRQGWATACRPLTITSEGMETGLPDIGVYMHLADATAITAGAVALMLEWELEQKNITGIDVFQIKSLLILGAIRPDFLEYPNREWGYGQLNLYNTFEAMRQL